MTRTGAVVRVKGVVRVDRDDKLMLTHPNHPVHWLTTRIRRQHQALEFCLLKVAILSMIKMWRKSTWGMSTCLKALEFHRERTSSWCRDLSKTRQIGAIIWHLERIVSKDFHRLLRQMNMVYLPLAGRVSRRDWLELLEQEANLVIILTQKRMKKMKCSSHPRYLPAQTTDIKHTQIPKNNAEIP